MAQWNVRQVNTRSEWSTHSNQNGSNELYHYGILGMKWGVRRTPEQLGHKEPKKVSVTGRIKDYGGFTAAEKRSLQNYRWKHIFEYYGGSEETRGIKTRSATDDGFDYSVYNPYNKIRMEVTIKDPYYSEKDNAIIREIGFSRPEPENGRIVNGNFDFNTEKDEEYEHMIRHVFGCTEQEAEDLMSTADLNWLSEQGLLDSIVVDTGENTDDEEDSIYEKTDPKELFKKNAEDLIKKATQKRPTKTEEVAKSKLSQLGDSIKAGAKQVASTIKEVGSKALDSAKDAINSGKAWIDQMFKKK